MISVPTEKGKTMREKLIELQKKAHSRFDSTCIGHGCDNCAYGSYDDCAERIKAEYLIANGVTVQKWIPVTERLPEKMGQYVCRYVFGDNTEYPFYQVLYYYTAVEKPHFQNEGTLELRVTHWMPLPEPPKGE